eukprot:761475-Hanusia_phi.AAC.3
MRELYLIRNWFVADRIESVESRGLCRACGSEVLTNQSRVCEEGSYFHADCHQILVEAIEAAKKQAREKTIAQLHANKSGDITRTVQYTIQDSQDRRDM